ncbi:MAG TPA: hypothetical protein VLG40_05155 [Candidatus Saccharimonas sp.]|nr:hypothetical protein [Candidatus Saccharimonas sp.]
MRSVLSRHKKATALVVFFLFNVAYAIIYIIAGLTILFFGTPHDSTGDGGPFKACLSSSLACTGPNYLVVALSILVLLLGYFMSANFAVRVGAFKNTRRAFVLFSGLSFLFSVGALLVACWRAV